MQLLQVLLPFTLLLCYIESREYHYDKPALPFLENGATTELHSTTNTLINRPSGINFPTVIQTLGPSASNYQIYDVKSSKQIFQGSTAPQPAPVTYQSSAQQVYYNPTPINVQVPQQVYFQNGAQVGQSTLENQFNTASSALQVPQQQVHFQQGAQVGQSTIVNPFNTAAINFAQNTLQYHSTPEQLIAQPVLNTLSGPPTQGNYVSQSEIGLLDAYPHKQQGGDPRVYKRIVTTCLPNGQCERLQLNPGPTDPNQSFVVWSTRTFTAPVTEKCRRIAEAKQTITIVQPTVIIRPANRRLFPYSEIVLESDTYN